MKLLRWFGLGLLVFICLLVARFPAASALQFVSLPKGIALTGVSGSIWHGRAESLTIKRFTAYELEWQLAFIPLLSGTAELALVAGQNPYSQLQLDGQLQLRSQSDWQASDLRFSLPAGLIQAYASLPFNTRLQGQLRGFVAEAVAAKPWCESLDAELVWQNAGVSSRYLKPALMLQNVEAKLSCQQGELLAQIKDPQRVLGMDLALRLDTQRHLFANGLLSPAAELPKSVKQGLMLFAQPENGGYRVQFDTQL